MNVCTSTLCSCKHQRWKGKSSGRGDHNSVGVTFICTQNGVCAGSGPPSLILYQLTPSPPSDTHSHKHSRGENWLAPDTFFFFSLFLLFFLSLLSLLSQDLLHSSGWAFLKLQVWSSAVTKEEDEDRDVCGVLCVCVWFIILRFLLCLQPCRSHLDCLLWRDNVMMSVNVWEGDYDVMSLLYSSCVSYMDMLIVPLKKDYGFHQNTVYIIYIVCINVRCLA